MPSATAMVARPAAISVHDRDGFQAFRASSPTTNASSVTSPSGYASVVATASRSPPVLDTIGWSSSAAVSAATPSALMSPSSHREARSWREARGAKSTRAA